MEKTFQFTLSLDLDLFTWANKYSRPEDTSYFTMNLDSFYDMESKKTFKTYLQSDLSNTKEVSNQKEKKLFYLNDISFEIEGFFDNSRTDVATLHYKKTFLMNNPDLFFKSNKNEPFKLKKLPLDSQLILSFYSPRVNDDNVICNVCFGEVCLPIYQLYNSSDAKRKYKIKYHRNIIGSCKAIISNFKFQNNYEWSSIGDLKQEITADNKSWSEITKEELSRSRNYTSQCRSYIYELDTSLPLSSRINSFYNYNALGRRSLGSLFIDKISKSNSLYWFNIFYYVFRRYLIRNGIYSDRSKYKLNDELIKREWSKVKLKTKFDLLSEMMCQLANSVLYIGDFKINKDGYETSIEDFNRTCLNNGSGDCEDVGLSILMDTYETFVNCGDITELNSPILFELKNYGKCLVPFLSLDRVTSKNVSESKSNPFDGVSAHINVFMINKYEFLNSIAVSSKTRELDRSDLIKFKQSELKKLEEVTKLIRQKYHKNFNEKTIENRVWEGTGAYYCRPNEEKDIKINGVKSRAIDLKMGFQLLTNYTLENRKPFFTHIMCGFTNFFFNSGIKMFEFVLLRSHSLSSKRFEKAKNSINIVDDLKKRKYGLSYKEFMTGKPIDILLMPIMKDELITDAIKESRMKTNLPSYQCSNILYQKIRRIGNEKLFLNDVPSLFKPHETICEIIKIRKESILKETYFDLDESRYLFRDGSSISTNRKHYGDYIMEGFKEAIQIVKSIKVKFNKKLKKRQNSYVDDFSPPLIYTTSYKFFLDNLKLKEFMNTILNNHRINYFEYYVEFINIYTMNILICLNI